MANIMRTGGSAGKAKKYLIKDGEYVVQPRSTTGYVTSYANSIRIFHNGGLNGNLTSIIDFSDTTTNFTVECDIKLGGTWNRVYVDDNTKNYFDLATLVMDGLMYPTQNGLIKLISTSGGVTYAKCDMRIKNVWYVE